MKTIISSLVLSIIVCFAHAQNFADKSYYLVDSLNLKLLEKKDHNFMDSCLDNYHSTGYDTSRLVALQGIVDYFNDYDFSMKYNSILESELKSLLSNNLDQEIEQFLMNILAQSFIHQGKYYYYKHEYAKSITLFEKSLKVSNKTKDKRLISYAYHQIGLSYNDQGDLKKALNYYNKSLKTDDNLKENATTLGAIGILYYELGNFEQALYYQKRSLNVARKINDFEGVASSLNALAVLYTEEGDTTNALRLYGESISLHKKEKNYSALAVVYSNVSLLYENLDELDMALSYAEKGLKIYEEQKDSVGIGYAKNDLGFINLKLGNISIAKELGEFSLSIGEIYKEINLTKYGALLLYKIAEHQNDYRVALEMYKMYDQLVDSIKSDNAIQTATETYTQHQFELEQLKKKQKEKENERIENERLNRRNMIQYSIIFLGVLGLFGIIILFGFMKISPSFAEGLIFFSFLILFEFVLVLAEPYVNKYTGGEPIFTLFANAGIAIAIFPMHSYFESKLKRRVVKKSIK